VCEEKGEVTFLRKMPIYIVKHLTGSS